MTILNGTTPESARGAITTVIGPNGAGKSTVFKTMFGLLPARSGTVHFRQARRDQFSPREMLDAGVGLHPARPQHFSRL